MSRRDASLSMQIARTSRDVAASSQRDAASMKTVAIVTMFFLPGTFVATLFDIPLLGWASDESSGLTASGRVTPGFWLYWAVAVPLTFATFAVWLSWRWWQDRKVRVADEEIELCCREGAF